MSTNISTMQKQLISIVLVFLYSIHVLDGYPSGAGLSACSKLTPQHEDAPKPSEYTSPYSVQVGDDIRTYSADFPIKVKVASASLPWQGIFLQARRYNGTGTVGYWDKPDESTNTRTMRCDAEDDTITHRNIAPKSSLQFIWNPPERDEGPVIFTGVIAAKKNMWWNDQNSYILTPVDYEAPTTTVATTMFDTKVTTEETTSSDEKTKRPTDDYDEKEEDDEYDYGDDSGASTQFGFSLLMVVCSLLVLQSSKK